MMARLDASFVGAAHSLFSSLVQKLKTLLRIPNRGSSIKLMRRNMLKHSLILNTLSKRWSRFGAGRFRERKKKLVKPPSLVNRMREETEEKKVSLRPFDYGFCRELDGSQMQHCSGARCVGKST
jgi:hypothetical protein